MEVQAAAREIKMKVRKRLFFAVAAVAAAAAAAFPALLVCLADVSKEVPVVVVGCFKCLAKSILLRSMHVTTLKH